jgi:hypothetical protein
MQRPVQSANNVQNDSQTRCDGVGSLSADFGTAMDDQLVATATKAKSVEVMVGSGKIVGEFVGVVTWAHWAVRVALELGRTQTVSVGLVLLVIQAKRNSHAIPQNYHELVLGLLAQGYPPLT